VDPHEALQQADLSRAEVARRAGGTPPGTTDALRQRLVALLEPSAAGEDPPADGEGDDARRCGALIMRLGDAATPTAIAAWMGWTFERTRAAVAELDRRLDDCGLRVSTEADRRLHVRERARLRARPQRLAFEVLASLDDPAIRHGLTHLVRGEPCPGGDEWMQPLLDVGAAIGCAYPGVRPAAPLAAAFAAVRQRKAVELFVDLDRNDRTAGRAEASQA